MPGRSKTKGGATTTTAGAGAGAATKGKKAGAGKAAASKTAPKTGSGVQKKSTQQKTAKKKVRLAKRDNPLYEKRPKTFGIGGDLQPKRDLTRFVRWPKYIKLQRQKRILVKRLKVPPVINQFNHTVDKNVAQTLFNFLEKYSPESKKEKKARLLKQAKAGGAPKKEDSKKPKLIKFGLNHITALVEQKKAKLVVIAHDVDPIELVLWLPTLCRKKGVPYLIVKGKARLGKVVGKKTATALAVVDVEQKDQKDLSNFIQKGHENFNDRYSQYMKMEGGGIMGYKHNTRVAKDERRRAKEKKDAENQQKAKRPVAQTPAQTEQPAQ